MPRKTQIVNMSLPLEIYEEVEKLAKKKKTSKSGILKESLEQYIKQEQQWNLIYKWGEEKAISLGIKDEKDVEKLIQEYRQQVEQGD